MKKLIALLLVLVSVFALTACNNAPAPTDPPATEPPATEPPATEPPKAAITDTMDVLIGKLIEKAPVEFMGMAMPLDLTNTTEDGLWMIKSYTGLENAEKITEGAVYEPMMGSIAYSLVTVRVKEGEDVKAVAQAMKDGIDTRKWICVEANDIQVAGYGDVIMLMMVDKETGLTSQAYVDAFKEIAGAELDFVI